MVSGSTTDVAAFIDKMVVAIRESGGRSRHIVADSMQLGANALAIRQTHREYFEFSARALKLLSCLLYTSDAADDLLCVDLGGRRIIKKKNKHTHPKQTTEE